MAALIISPNRQIADEFLESLGRRRRFDIVGDLRAYPAGANIETRISQLRPDVLLLDVATDLNAAGELIRLVTAHKPPIHVIALHTHNDSEAIVRSLRYGASEFLSAPFDEEVQEAAIVRIQKLLRPTGAEREAGKVVVFSSAKPGSGASTLALQTAYSIRKASSKRVLLADFDLVAGSLGSYMKLDSLYSLIDVLRRADQIDHELWSTVTDQVEGVDVLPAPAVPFTDPAPQGGLHQVLQHARNNYDWTVVDLPSVFHRLSLLTLTESDRAFLVSTGDLASLHLARKAVKLTAQLGLDSHKLQLLINRMDKRSDLNASDLSKLFECEVNASLPNDHALQRAVTNGRSLDVNSEFTRAIDGLAGKLLGKAPEAKKQSSRFAIRPLLSHT